ncbi:TonB-dependent receptor [Chitinophaga niastensis]|uniref:TonB-dependent receptor n=1 Tax=Chitinophaga niastensis TaxID=536980 RepID=A0A2P8HNZ3_CHINA|nr:TonB-dependent receptor [Chitinophaga niastensis]PSL47940.1 TonB-dependent receptor [Chitinophaga niastensis]
MINHRCCLLFFLLFLPGLLFAQSATVKGVVFDAKNNTPLVGAYVHLDGSHQRVTTDAEGKYELTGIKPGAYKMKVEYIGYLKYEKKVQITGSQSVALNISLSPTIAALHSVSVFGKINGETDAASRSAEKTANNITNVIGAHAMERSPDINAANVLQRVSGVTIERNSGADQAYAIVRGLEPRYSNTLINGIKISSPDEKSRYVSLDVVPSDLLQRIEVSKSLLPEMEGDAIGGTVNLIFKDAPDAPLFKAMASVGYSNIFFDRKYTSFSKSDIQKKSMYDKNGAAYVAKPGDFSRSNLDFKDKTAPPTTTVGFTYGRRFLKNKLGLLIADNFQNQYYGTNSEFNIVAPDNKNNFKPGITDVANRTYSTQQLNNGLSAHLDYNINDRNKLSLNNVFLYSYMAQSRLSIDTSITGGNGGRVGPGTGSVFNDNRSLTNHQYLENLKLEGKHILSRHFLFDWAGVYSSAAKKSPDRADIAIDHKINADYTSTPFYFDGISRIWQHNTDRNDQVQANLTYKQSIGSAVLELKAGGLYRHKIRENAQDQYQLRPILGSSNTKQPFTDIYAAQWEVYNPKGTADYDVNAYHAFENISAGFGQAKLSFHKLDVFGGVRVEGTSQGFDYANYIATLANNVRIKYRDLLPSAMLKYKLNEKTNLRASYYKSISRPNYFELVPYTILGTDYNQMGNPNLKHTVADNYDIRYELYPKEDEEFFIGGFYKSLTNPIENVLQSLSSGDLVYQPQNAAAKAKIAGAELAFTKFWGNIGITGNYTYIYSDVFAPKIDPLAPTVDKRTVYQHRPLQGQANNVLNLSLEYKNTRKQIFAQLAYQYVGKTLSDLYFNTDYDYYQQPQSFLSLSADKTFNKHFTLFGKFNNLLNTPTIVRINGITVGKDIYKANFNIGVRYSH